MSAQQPFESSLQENSPDVNGDDFITELLFYFRGFQYFNDTEDKIKKICYIEQDKKVWSLDEIKQAWEEAKSLGKKEKKYWSRVILLQELKRRVCNDKGKRSMPGNVLEEDVDFVKGPRKRRTSSFESKAELKRVADDTSQAAEDLQNLQSLIIGEQIQKHILIPLSVISENETVSIQDVGDSTSNPTYKLKDGVPYTTGNPSGNEIRKRKSYVMSYNNDTKNADWTYEILNLSTLAKNSLELNFNSTNYDKGHLAAAANHRWCIEAKNDAALFSNITPQHDTLNRGVWKALENYCRTTAEKPGCNVHVYTGPLYLNLSGERVGGKALPSHFFKVMIVEDDNVIAKEPECYRMPNVTINQFCRFDDPEFKVNIGDIERDSGLTFVKQTPTMRIRDSIKTITWQGKNEDEQECTADIKFRISS